MSSLIPRSSHHAGNSTNPSSMQATSSTTINILHVRWLFYMQDYDNNLLFGILSSESGTCKTICGTRSAPMTKNLLSPQVKFREPKYIHQLSIIPMRLHSLRYVRGFLFLFYYLNLQDLTSVSAILLFFDVAIFNLLPLALVFFWFTPTFWCVVFYFHPNYYLPPHHV